jgi:hypothetical protein
MITKPESKFKKREKGGGWGRKKKKRKRCRFVKVESARVI